MVVSSSYLSFPRAGELAVEKGNQHVPSEYLYNVGCYAHNYKDNNNNIHFCSAPSRINSTLKRFKNIANK